MTGIQCHQGHVFSMISDDYIDAEWKLQECYYMSQECEVVKDEFLSFSPASETKDCSHCSILEHKFEELIEEIKGEL